MTDQPTPEALRRLHESMCSVDGCSNAVRAKGLCPLTGFRLELEEALASQEGSDQ